MPVIRPLEALPVNQVGNPENVNVNALPSRSAAVGVNVYAVPICTVLGGVPEIVGARFGALVT